MDRSSGLIGGGITPFSKEPYVTLSRHTAPSRVFWNRSNNSLSFTPAGKEKVAVFGNRERGRLIHFRGEVLSHY